MLTGKKPLDLENKSFDEVLQTINTSQPVPPSLIPDHHANGHEHKVLRGDLDNIALMALRKEPDRRYRSVEDLATDIERHLEGRPINARPNTISYRAGKFLKRHKIGVAAAALVAISVITGIVFTLWQANVARRERDRAEKRFQDVRQLSNSLLFEIAPKIERLQGSTEARELLVMRALVYLDSLAGETQTDAGLQSELADAYQKIGDLQGNPRKPNLSDFAGAIESYLKSRSILEKLPNTSENRKRLAESYRELAMIRFAQNEIKESISDSERSLELFAALILEEPDSAVLAKAHTATQLDYGHTHSINNQYAIAIPIYREAVAKIGQMDRSDPEVLRLLALGTSYLSNALSWDGQQTEAEAENDKAVQLARELESKYPTDPDVQKTVYSVYTLASSNFENIKNDISLEFAEKALSVARRSSEADPVDTQAKQNLAKALSRYGIILVLLKRNDEGFESLKAAEAATRELIAREPRNKVYQDDLGTLYTRFGDAEKMRSNLIGALENYKRSADVFKSLAETDEKNTVAQRDWAQAVKSVGVTEIKLGQKPEARASLTLAIQIVDRLKQQNALGKWDEKIFNEMHPLLAKLNE